MVARLPQCFFKILFSLLRKVLGSPSIQKNLKKHYTKSSYHLAYFRWSKINEGLIRSGNSRFRIFTHTLVIWKYEHFSFLKWHSAQVLREIILIAKKLQLFKISKTRNPGFVNSISHYFVNSLYFSLFTISTKSCK